MKSNSTFPIYRVLVLLLITTSILSTQTASAAALSSIQIQPATPARLLAGQTLQLTATGTYSDGSTADITTKVTWSISNTSVAKISAAGLVSIVESAGGPGMPGMPSGPRPGNRSRPAGGPSPGDGAGGPDGPPPDGGFGGPGFPPGGPIGPGNGPGGPDGNRPPPVEGGFETSFVSPLFGDNMVLQRGKPNTIWGWAKLGQEIRVTIADNTVKTVTKDDGRWSAVIEPPAPGGPYTLVVDGPQHVEFHDVLVGDVWLCGGQSNMEMGLGQARNGSEEVKAADHPRIRLFVVKQQTARKPAAIPQGSWKICSPQNVGEGWSGFSAVAYFFGRRLQQEVDVPIGLVEDCGGGAPAEAWTRAETLRSLGISDTGSGPNTPVVLYNGMIAPVAPLAISGAIWYQGESNTERATQYRKLLPAMIADWRKAFKQGDFPFYIVSLAAHKQHKDTPGDDSWAELRAAQDFVANTVTNSGLAVAIDVGDARDVHPKDKKEVGERLALVALAGHYGKNIPYSGPRFASVEKIPGALRISFTHTDGGLVVKGDKLEEFCVSAEDCRWHWADARIVGDTVVVSSSEVSNPVAARYAWQANPKATLFNGAGLPAIPFRTDYVGGTNDNKLGGKE
jgi:sialate O-acetylesterase